jgi:hypothetical protein
MITAEEFMTDAYQIKHYGTILMKPTQSAIEFAKLHCEAQAKAIINVVDDYEMNSVILNAYPKTNII